VDLNRKYIVVEAMLELSFLDLLDFCAQNLPMNLPC